MTMKNEESTGKFIIGEAPEMTTELLQELEGFQQEQNTFEAKLREQEEKKRQEKWEGMAIMPFGFNIMIQPYKENPYLKKINDAGLILDHSTSFSQETGRNDAMDCGIPCARVVEVGPDVKHVKRGDEIIYAMQRVVPVPFMNTGFLLLNEGAVLCIINKGETLEERFEHLKS